MFSKVDYKISMEIDGIFAMFSRPDSGINKSSLPAPPQSAAKGMFESVLFMPTVVVEPIQTVICKPIQTTSYGFVSKADGTKVKNLKSGNHTTFDYEILYDVCYKLFAKVRNADPRRVKRHLSKEALQYEQQNINHAHSYAAQFQRKIKKGRTQKAVFLGISEFLSSYCGPLRESTQACSDININIPAMPVKCFKEPTFATCMEPTFTNAEISQGILNYA